MILVKLFEVVLTISLIYFIVVQVVIPAVRGVKLFPLFRAGELTALEAKLEDTYQKEVEVKVKQEIVAVESRVKAKEEDIVAKIGGAAQTAKSEVQSVLTPKGK